MFVEKIKVLAIVGPTACGKTKLSIELAKAYNAEIISADSMQIYKEMNIATAKPDKEEMQGIIHHLMDFLPPETEFSVSDFVALAKEKIKQIHDNGKLPIIVGGTGLYINSLLSGVKFVPIKYDEALRSSLYEKYNKDNGDELYAYLCKIDKEASEIIHKNNMVRVVRAVEVYELTGKTFTEHNKDSLATEAPYDSCVIGLNYIDRAELYERINERVDIMLDCGLLDEAKKVLGMQLSKTAINAIGYKELVPYFDGESTLIECTDKIKQESRRYAKRQLTWFNKNEEINWILRTKDTEFVNIYDKSKKIVECFLDL